MFGKLFDLTDEEIMKFNSYISQFIEELDVTKEETNEGISQFNAALVNLECDYVFVDTQYSRILIEMIREAQIDVPKIKWYSEEDEMADIFVKVFVRLVELKYNESDKDLDEAKEFVEENNMKVIMKDKILPMLMEEGLVEDYKENIEDHEVIYPLLGLDEYQPSE